MKCKLTKILSFCLSFLLCYSYSISQEKKYPSLFWEISGKGLKKPSYLFGTMHISNKFVFNLSDNFYNALKNVDVVALELNPALWQQDMMQLEDMKKNHYMYFSNYNQKYLYSNTFQYLKYPELIAEALKTEPYVINSLLYRGSKSKSDYEEDTYLDLYIYQSGKKFGKECTGLENYLESQKIITEGYYDMYFDKKKKKDRAGDYELEDKLNEAYRNGDLDKLDSLQTKLIVSNAFNDKFLIKRNDIHAASIDSIIRKGKSVFAGVGAAHLAGERGVIESLRKAGYTMTPIKMKQRATAVKEKLDKVRVPITLKKYDDPDGRYSVLLPGNLYNYNSNNVITTKQIADMPNGLYYSVSRVPTYSAMLGDSNSKVIFKIDSMLYENIPGKILSKKSIQKFGYQGFDITNRTRRGDVNRYNIFVTPVDVLIFKMKGTGDFILNGDGYDADKFFNSITLMQPKHTPTTVKVDGKEFSFQMPGEPYKTVLEENANGIYDSYEFNYTTPDLKKYFQFYKANYFSYLFIEEDSFELNLINHSLLETDEISYLISKKFGNYQNYPAAEFTYKMQDSSTLKVKAIRKGTNFYILSIKSKNGNEDLNKDADTFFNSLNFSNSNNPATISYKEKNGYFTVQTPFYPKLDTVITPILLKTDKISSGMFGMTMQDPIAEKYFDDFQENYNNFTFANPHNNEFVSIYYYNYKKYVSFADSIKMWENHIADKAKSIGAFVKSKQIRYENGNTICEFIFSDTGSTKLFRFKTILNSRRFYSISSITDSNVGFADWVNVFFNTFTPNLAPSGSMYESKYKEFITDFNSQDEDLAEACRKTVNDVNFKGYDLELRDLILNLSNKEKNYFALKKQLINELGRIQDTSRVKEIVNSLRTIYAKSEDTLSFQNQVLPALVGTRSLLGYNALKEMLLQDPPDFSDLDNESYGLFKSIGDSLELAATMFPDLLQLTTIEAYKMELYPLLATLLDSNKISPKVYESSLQKILFDAKFVLKKLQKNNEKKLEKELVKSRKNAVEVENDERDYDDSEANYDLNYASKIYSVILAPYYNKSVGVQKYFEKILSSKDTNLIIETAMLFIKNGIEIKPDLLHSIATSDKFSGTLFRTIVNEKKQKYFPANSASNSELAVSLIKSEFAEEWKKGDIITFLTQQEATVNNHKGTVLYYKVRLKNQADWQIGYAGLFNNSSAADTVIYGLEPEKIEDKDMKNINKKVNQLNDKIMIKSRQSGEEYFRKNYGEE